MTPKRTAVSWNPRRYLPSPQQNKTVSSAPSTSVRLPQPEQEDAPCGDCRGTHANACLCIPVKIRAWPLHLAVWDPDRRCLLVGRHGEGASLQKRSQITQGKNQQARYEPDNYRNSPSSTRQEYGRIVPPSPSACKAAARPLLNGHPWRRRRRSPQPGEVPGSSQRRGIRIAPCAACLSP